MRLPSEWPLRTIRMSFLSTPSEFTNEKMNWTNRTAAGIKNESNASASWHPKIFVPAQPSEVDPTAQMCTA